MLAERTRHSSARESFGQLEACERLGIAAIAVDVNFHIAFFNEKAKRMTEYSREKAMRKSIFDIVVSGDLKKCLRRAIKGNTIEPGFVTRCKIVTRGGKIRNVEWHGITLYGEGEVVGVLLTGIDVTESELVREAARIAVKARDMDDMAMSFMDLIGDPLNLKIARMSIYVEGRPPLTLTRVFPHGGVRKKPRNALDDTSDDRIMETRYFKLRPGDRSIGVLEVTAYAGSRLIEDDIGCVQALCDIVSSGIDRLLPPVRQRPELSQVRETGSMVAIVDSCDYRVIDASDSFCAMAGTTDLKGMRLDEIISSAGIAQALRSTVSSGMPQWGSCPDHGSVFCCMPAGDMAKNSSAILVSLMNVTPGSYENGDKMAVLRSAHAENILSMLPHGLAVCDCQGIVVTANNIIAQMLGTEKKLLEGRVFADVLNGLNPEHAGGKPMKRKQMAVYNALKTRSPVEDILAISVGSRRMTIATIVTPLCDPTGVLTGCIITVRDATLLHALLRMSHIIAEAPRTEDLVDEALDIIMNASRLKFAWLYLYDGSELILRLQKGDISGAPLPLGRETPDPDSPTMQCKAFYRGRAVLIKDYRRCASIRTFDPMARSRSIRSITAIPLLADSRTIGVLVAATGQNDPLREAQLAELSAMCDQLSTGIARSQNGENSAYLNPVS